MIKNPNPRSYATRPGEDEAHRAGEEREALEELPKEVSEEGTAPMNAQRQCRTNKT